MGVLRDTVLVAAATFVVGAGLMEIGEEKQTFRQKLMPYIGTVFAGGLGYFFLRETNLIKATENADLEEIPVSNLTQSSVINGYQPEKYSVVTNAEEFDAEAYMPPKPSVNVRWSQETDVKEEDIINFFKNIGKVNYLKYHTPSTEKYMESLKDTTPNEEERMEKAKKLVATLRNSALSDWNKAYEDDLQEGKVKLDYDKYRFIPLTKQNGITFTTYGFLSKMLKHGRIPYGSIYQGWGRVEKDLIPIEVVGMTEYDKTKLYLVKFGNVPYSKNRGRGATAEDTYLVFYKNENHGLRVIPSSGFYRKMTKKRATDKTRDFIYQLYNPRYVLDPLESMLRLQGLYEPTPMIFSNIEKIKKKERGKPATYLYKIVYYGATDEGLMIPLITSPEFADKNTIKTPNLWKDEYGNPFVINNSVGGPLQEFIRMSKYDPANLTPRRIKIFNEDYQRWVSMQDSLLWNADRMPTTRFPSLESDNRTIRFPIWESLPKNQQVKALQETRYNAHVNSVQRDNERYQQRSPENYQKYVEGGLLPFNITKNDTQLRWREYFSQIIVGLSDEEAEKVRLKAYRSITDEKFLLDNFFEHPSEMKNIKDYTPSGKKKVSENLQSQFDIMRLYLKRVADKNQRFEDGDKGKV